MTVANPTAPTDALVRMSYSAFRTYLQCPKKYQLTRLLHVPERPSLAAIGGLTVHEVTEALDRASLTS